MSPTRGEDHGHGDHAGHEEVPRIGPEQVLVDDVVGDSVKHGTEHDLCFHSGNRGPDAPVAAKSEGQVPVGRPVEGDLVGAVEGGRVVVGRHPTDHHHVASGDLSPAQFHITGRGAGESLTGAVETEELLDCGWDKGPLS